MTPEEALREFVHGCEVLVPNLKDDVNYAQFVANALRSLEDWPELAEIYLHAKQALEQPTDDFDSLAEAMRKAGVPDDALDDAVHDAASENGSSANNQGFAGQLRLLAVHWGKYEALRCAQKAITDTTGKKD
jgi:hypothetical protein